MTSLATECTNFIISRRDWSQGRFETAPIGDLEPGQVLFRVDRFALTSNNISYCAAGDMLDYWGFFPAEEGSGRVPVMGFADVIASRHPEVSPRGTPRVRDHRASNRRGLRECRCRARSGCPPRWSTDRGRPCYRE